MKKVGLYFGTFNPIHKGHLSLANFFLNDTGLEEIWFVVSPQNPLKKESDFLNSKQRLELVNLVLEDHPKLKSCELEFDLPTPSYTSTTLGKLKEIHPHLAFVLLMGQDNIADFEKWQDFEKILRENDIYVYPRKDSNPVPERFNSHPNIQFFNAPLMEISSSEIRELVHVRKNVQMLLPKKAFSFLEKFVFNI